MVALETELFAKLPVGKFQVILADPPWSYYGAQNKWAAAAKFYKTLTDEEIQQFPIKNLMADKSVLFLWATAPRLDAALDAIRAWGLHYRGVAFTWVKTTKDGKPIGAQGVRPSIVKPTCEFVLAASNVKKGRPLRVENEKIVHTVFAPALEHSTKPVGVHENIEALYPTATKLELFARRKRSGWTVWGDQVG